jgi:hypothetical protein
VLDRRTRVLLLLLLLLAAGVAWVAAAPKFALVIGNSQYDSLGALKNPVNDASDMAAALKRLGFEVDLLTDAELPDMESAVLRLKNRLSISAAATGLFFYAGHGVQSAGVNYLIPVRANISDEAFLKTKALAAQTVLDLMQDAGNTLNLVFLDACRDNPFAWSRGGGRGLSVVSVQPRGSIIVYATSAGSVASDGDGRNGVFTGELLKNMETPGLDLNTMLDRTAQGVLKATASRQNPAIYKQYFQTAYLAGDAPAPAGPTVEVVPVVAQETMPATDAAGAFVIALKDPGAELQPVTKNGWRQVSGDWTIARGSDDAGVSALSGANFFWAGKSAQGELAQDVDIKSAVAALNGGDATITLRGSVASFSGDNDSSRMILEVYSASGKLLAYVDSGPQDSDTWKLLELSKSITAQAATARVRLIAKREKGNDNNGYFDDISLVISGVPKAVAIQQRPVTTAAPAAAPVEPPKPTAIQTEFGYFATDGELNADDLHRGSTTYDLYTVAAKKGDSVSVTVSRGVSSGAAIKPTLVLTSPTGVSARGTGALKVTLRENGTYTLEVGAAASSQPQGYSLQFHGPGTDYEGSLDWNDERRTFEGNYDFVDIDALVDGWYTLELSSNEFKTKMFLEDTKGSPWLMDNGKQARDDGGGAGNNTKIFFHNVREGKMRIMIMDSSFTSIRSGAWRLRVTLSSIGASFDEGGR